MKKRIVALLLAVLLVLTLAACGGKTTSSAPEESKPAESKPEESKPEESKPAESTPAETGGEAWGPDNPIDLTGVACASEIQGDFNEIQILKEYNERSGIHIDWQTVPYSDKDTQLNLMLGSGELPDVLYKMGVNSTDQAKYTAQGLFVAFSDYPELMTNLQYWFDQYPTAEQAMTQEDGKVYGAPYILAGDAIRCSTKMWYNTDVLEKLGVKAEDIKTTEDFYQYLKKCADLDYTGKGDQIPLTASGFDSIEYYFYGSFNLMNRGSSHPNVFIDDDGSLKFAYTSENYKEELKYLNKLYTEKLIDQDVFTMDYAQEIAKCTTGRGLTYLFVNNSCVSNSEYEQYSLAAAEPYEGPQGYKIFSNYSLPASTAAQFMISYTCEEKGEDYVKAAMTWMDHWYSEEGIKETFMGIEGLTYEADADSPGGYKYTDMVLNDPDGRTFEQVLAAYVPWAGGRNPSVATNEFFKGGETWPVCLVAVEGLRNYFPEEVWAPFNRYWTADESDEMGKISTDMSTYRSEWRSYFVTGQKSLDTDWDEYVAGYNGMKLDRYMELYQKGFEAHEAEK